MCKQPSRSRHWCGALPSWCGALVPVLQTHHAGAAAGELKLVKSLLKPLLSSLCVSVTVIYTL